MRWRIMAVRSKPPVYLARDEIGLHRSFVMG